MTLNIFEAINNSISDFVENQENKALKRGTGSYSIPFRGSIFGEIETAKVLSKLNAESVDVIWLGSILMFLNLSTLFCLLPPLPTTRVLCNKP